jgi:nitrite reductase/ring-hydroxylating ferredoxin subunit/uncharacterized membrane protein
VKDLASGTHLGHPLHPVLTDLPIGFWTSATVLDLFGGKAARPAARHLVAWGLWSVIPTAWTGGSDWSDTTGPARRVGFVHAALNLGATAWYASSWLHRRRGRHAIGVAHGLVGAVFASAAGYLGGHLVDDLGVGVDHTAFEDRPRDWCAVAPAGDVVSEPSRVLAGEVPVVVTRHRGELRALAARCPHRGGPMEQGSIVGDSIVCPWHASRFSLTDGTLERGPATTDLPCYAVRVVDGVVEVRGT